MNRTAPTVASSALSVSHSQDLPGWLRAAGISLGLTTYQTNRLFLIGTRPDGSLSAFERMFDGAMGLHATSERLLIATRAQLWQLDSAPDGAHTAKGYDRLYVPRIAHTTGNLDIHDVAMERSGRVVFVNTRYSCLATTSDRYSFKSVWRPSFISRLQPEDRCHLNGLAMRDGEARYMTAIAESDRAGGWRERRRDGGIVIDISTDEVIATGLSMPHSPRWHAGKLWLLNSGSGELGYLDPCSGRFEPVAFCPGYLRGLCFHGDYAIVGLSKPRDNRLFRGLELDENLQRRRAAPRCGTVIIDLRTGAIVHWLEFAGVVTELFDVQILPGVKCPKAVGLKHDDILRLVSFEEGEQAVLHDVPAPPRQLTPAPLNPVTRKPGTSAYVYQAARIEADVLLRRFDALTFPRLSRQMSGVEYAQPLITITAQQAGTPVGMIVSVYDESDRSARVLSLFVLPEHRGHGIGRALLLQLETLLRGKGCRALQLRYQDDWRSSEILERVLVASGWTSPQAVMLQCRGTMRGIAAANWLRHDRLPEGFEIFPWSELDARERSDILARQQRDPWFPAELSPFQEEARIEYLNSIGLRYRGEVVGWMITHRLDDNTIQYTSLFVRKEFQRAGRAIPLLVEAIRRQIPSGIERGVCQIHLDSMPMVRYMKRRIWPHDTNISELRISVKALVGENRALSELRPESGHDSRGDCHDTAEAVAG